MSLRYTTPEQRLAAWLTLHPQADGRSPERADMNIMGVRTTRIFCRPICSARPKVENLIWFSDKPSAIAAGFRPCQRCRP